MSMRRRSATIMAAFAYNSAMTDERLPRKDAASPYASLLAVTAVQDAFEELAFRNSGWDFSICGHPVHPNEIPDGFPAALAVSSFHSHDHLGE